jgi:hypothetical protein
MGNMSYCRFENTLDDLRDCMDALYEISGNIDQLNESEQTAAKRLIKLCFEIADDYGDNE